MVSTQMATSPETVVGTVKLDQDCLQNSYSSVIDSLPPNANVDRCVEDKGKLTRLSKEKESENESESKCLFDLIEDSTDDEERLIEQLQKLISQDGKGEVDLNNDRNNAGETVLHVSARRGLRSFVKLLLESYKVNPRATNFASQTPIDVATTEVYEVFVSRFYHDLRLYTKKNDVVKLAKLLALLCKNPSGFPFSYGVKLLHIASLFGSVDVAKYLIEVLQVPVDVPTKSGKTALHYAVLSSNSDTIRLLLKYGADPRSRDCNQTSCIEMANNGQSQRILQKVARLRSFGVVSPNSVFRLGKSSSPPCSRKEKKHLTAIVSDLFSRSNLLDSICLIGFSRKLQKENADSTLSTLDSNEKENKRESQTNKMTWKNFMLPSIDSRETTVLDAFPGEMKGWHSSLEKGTESTSSKTSKNLKMMPEINRCSREAGKYFMSRNSNTPRFVVFVFTDEHGLRSYCYILTFNAREVVDKELQESGNRNSKPLCLPRCLCIVSQYPFYSFFRTLLFDLFTMAKWTHKEDGSDGAIELSAHFLDRFSPAMRIQELCRVEMPLSTRSLPQVVDTGVRSLALQSPRVAGLPFVDDECFKVLMSCLSPKNIVILISALLSEQSILLITDHIELAYPIAEALISLIFPFEWVHVYIPLLSKETIKVVQAPFPFLVGIRTSHLNLISGERLCSLTLVNVDRDSVVRPIEPNRLDVRKDAGHSDAEYLTNDDLTHTLQTHYEKQYVLENMPQEMQECLIKSLEENVGSRSRRASTNPNPVIPDEVSKEDLVYTEIKTRTPKSVVTPERVEMLAAKLSLAKVDISVVLTESDISHLRKCCLKIMVDLIASYSLFDYDHGSRLKFLRSQPESRRSFLRMLLNTQIWSCFEYEMQKGTLSYSRELNLSFYKDVVNSWLKLDRIRIKAHNITLYESAQFDSKAIGCLYKGDIVTISFRKEVRNASLEWLKIRDMKGWCLLNPVRDFELLEQPDFDVYLEKVCNLWNSTVYPYENNFSAFDN